MVLSIVDVDCLDFWDYDVLGSQLCIGAIVFTVDEVVIAGKR